MSIHHPPGVIHMTVPTIPDALMPEAYKDDDRYGGCCMGAAMRGAEYCLCWEIVYDLDQVEPPEPVTYAECGPRSTACGDCAYRPSSPERSGADYVEENLLGLTGNPKTPFWCHVGMRRIVAWVHPDGRRVDVPDEVEFHSYDPPIIDHVGYKADGTPADLCAGWAARS